MSWKWWGGVSVVDHMACPEDAAAAKPQPNASIERCGPGITAHVQFSREARNQDSFCVGNGFEIFKKDMAWAKQNMSAG